MYRIEVAPGEETVFRTIEELAIGIRNGVITPRARVYHHASQKWLPIGLHPHYKKALEMPAAPQPTVTIATPIPTPSRLKAHSQTHQPAPPQSVAYAPEPKPAAAPGPTLEPKPAPRAAPAPRVSAPVPSPVIAMQNEILRGLPVVSIPEPEPLPWNVPAPRVSAPPAQAQPAPAHPAPAPPAHAQPTHAHTPAKHAPVAYVPLEFSAPEREPPHTDSEGLLLPRPTARRSRRARGRPVMLLGVATVLVVGTHLVLTPTPLGSPDPTAAPVAVAGNPELKDASLPPVPDAPQEPALDRYAGESQSSEAPAVAAALVTIAPARVPMTPGPAFAGSVPARRDVDSAALKAPAPKVTAPAPTPPPLSPSIAPAPTATEMALPDLRPDSVVTAVRTVDTLGMKKILRALNGTKPVDSPAAP